MPVEWYVMMFEEGFQVFEHSILRAVALEEKNAPDEIVRQVLRRIQGNRIALLIIQFLCANEFDELIEGILRNRASDLDRRVESV